MTILVRLYMSWSYHLFANSDEWKISFSRCEYSWFLSWANCLKLLEQCLHTYGRSVPWVSMWIWNGNTTYCKALYWGNFSSISYSKDYFNLFIRKIVNSMGQTYFNIFSIICFHHVSLINILFLWVTISFTNINRNI